MSKTPDEIKKGLECHINGECNQSCPYFGIKFGCGPHMVPDALDLIQQLEAEKSEQAEKIRVLEARVKQLKAERDAAVALIPRVCRYCNHDGTADYDVDSVCDYCLNGNTRWEWRGVQKEE